MNTLNPSQKSVLSDSGHELNMLRQKLEQSLVHEFHDDHWEGELSSSALSTAVAVIALQFADANKYRDFIRAGIDWLERTMNKDGGYGDTVTCPSNLSTSLLVWCAFAKEKSSVVQQLETWLCGKITNLDPSKISGSILKHYGNDRTFSVPILMTCALTGRLGEHPWQYVPQLPFELAALPRALFRFIGLPVVSYALPALIAIGWSRHYHSHHTKCPIAWLRNTLMLRIFKLLIRIQPANGGFLEAAPLTAFVVMNLASSGYKDSIVVQRGIGFLIESMRGNGSWPIDTHLATWVTSLSVKALGKKVPNQKKVTTWLRDQQYQTRHPFTDSKPGGWAWSPLEGGVPDADDTSGALIALKQQLPDSLKNRTAYQLGIRWLLDLQNRDGGFPTFCKGWGCLAFDRSCPDITAHALQAICMHESTLSKSLKKRANHALLSGIQYLKKNQRADGAWLPLWFGNPWTENHENPVYGTSRVLLALTQTQLSTHKDISRVLENGKAWLMQNQNYDGGWGCDESGNSTIEETALALESLSPDCDEAVIEAGFRFLINAWGKPNVPTPIGLYFSSLWYSEKLYPFLFTLNALNVHWK